MRSEFATLVLVPATPRVLQDLKTTNTVYAGLIISIWELGEGIGPFLYAPLSETYGRLPVYHTGNAIFVLSSLGCALSRNISTLLMFRFLSGLGCTVLVLGPAILGDIFDTRHRGKALTMNMAFGVVGGTISPIVGGYLAEAVGWRWTSWVVLICAGTFALASAALLPETYPKVVARKLSKIGDAAVKHVDAGTEDTQQRTTTPSSPSTSIHEFLTKGLIRPVQIMLLSPVILILSVYIATTYGINYLIVTTLPTLMGNVYSFSTSDIGKVFLAGGKFLQT